MNADFPPPGKICMHLNAVFLRRRKVRVHSSIQTTVLQGGQPVSSTILMYTAKRGRISAVFRSIDGLAACFCIGRNLCSEPSLPVATPVAALWRSFCKLHAQAKTPRFLKWSTSWGWSMLRYGVLRARQLQELKQHNFRELWCAAQRNKNKANFLEIHLVHKKPPL